MKSINAPKWMLDYFGKLGLKQEHDNAFHALLELDLKWLPTIIEACQVELQSKRKRYLIEIVWRFRDPSVIPFLGSMLEAADDLVWQEALNGLVSFGEKASVQEIDRALEDARVTDNKTKIKWLAEAREQILSGGSRPMTSSLPKS